MSSGMNSFDSKAFRDLHKRIQEEAAKRADSLVNGSARSNDAATTAARYEHEIGFRLGLENVIIMMKEIEDDILGRKRTS